MSGCYRPLGVVGIRRAVPGDAVGLGDLARRIWRACFRGMISDAQLEYMLAQRYEEGVLAATLGREWPRFELLSVDGEPAAFAAHGPQDQPRSWKLHQLYVDPEWQKRGLAGRLLEQVEGAAREHGCAELLLTVNRGNAHARAVYEHRGFVVREAARFDIGGGFVMDDFVMVKALA